MSALGGSRGASAGAGTYRRLVAVLIAAVLVAGCDDTLEPFQESDDAIFSLFGYLDLKADTQWVRVMPVRRNLFLEPGPSDAVVTLEHLGSGRVVMLHDSLFAFADERLGGVGYAHNFWTTEPLEPEATYRLTATRPDGAASTAVVVMPEDPQVIYIEDNNDRRRGTTIVLLQVRAGHVISAETIYDMGRYAGNPPVLTAANAVPEAGHAEFPSQLSGMIGIHIDVDTLLIRPGLVDVIRRQFRIAVAPADWPYDVGLSDLDIAVPGTAPSNVENGVGFVGAATVLRIPFDACEPLVPSSGGQGACATVIDATTTSVEGRVIREPCGDPYALEPIRLIERLGGGGTIRTWKTGWRGQYRFLGLRSDADLSLELGPGLPSVDLPPLQPGERYTVDDIAVSGGC